MSLADILNAIRASYQEQGRQIEDDAEKEIQEILSAAKKRGRLLQAEARATAALSADAHCASTLHRAQLEALQILGAARERLVDEALGQTREALTRARADSAYPDALRHLATEALAEIEEPAGLVADPRDRELLQQILRETGCTPDVDYGIECCGGVVAQSVDGRIVAANTLESRLANAEPYLRQHLASLFEAAVWRSGERRTERETGAPADRIQILVSTPSADDGAPRTVASSV